MSHIDHFDFSEDGTWLATVWRTSCHYVLNFFFGLEPFLRPTYQKESRSYECNKYSSDGVQAYSYKLKDFGNIILKFFVIAVS